MSLLSALGRISQTHDESFLDLTDQVAREAEAPELAETVAQNVATDRADDTPAPEQPVVAGPSRVEDTPVPEEVNLTMENSKVVDTDAEEAPPAPATAPEKPSDPEQRSDPEQAREPEQAGEPDDDVTDSAVETVRPEGLPAGAGAIALSPEEREVAFAGTPVVGSVVDGGSAQDMLDGNYPRPSVASQREIDEFDRLRQAGLDLVRPKNWPEFMTFPTEGEMRSLLQDGVTPEMIKDFEASKQLQADEMEARAREINEWIFSFGDMGLNEVALRERSQNRKRAIRRRATGPDGRVQKQNENEIDPSELTDEELYGDRHYGIRFALLLNTTPDAIGKVQSAPVAAWGHDQLRTMDGGRIQVKGDEIIVRRTSMEAARLLVMEAKARGWETIRVSGHNEFCAAVKRAAKEEGIGAIIHRRGPLGLGPFSRPEVVMPPIPRVQPLNRKDPNEQERERKASEAPAEDRKAATDLLDPNRKPGRRPVKVEDPLAGPDRKDPIETPEQSAPEPT